MPLVLNSKDGDISVPNDSIIFFIDETGHELMDDGNPFFGLAGCGIRSQFYDSHINQVWRGIKLKFFGDEDYSLHAADPDIPDKKEFVECIGKLFSELPWLRCASVTNKELATKNIDAFGAVAVSFQNRICEVLKWQAPFSKVMLIFEENGRKTFEKPLIDYFDDFHIKYEDSNDIIEVEKFVMLGKSNECGLEIADFVAHAAGCHAKNRLAAKQNAERKDFNAVFKNCDNRSSSFCFITEAELKMSESFLN